jgi:hypothetical protein
MLQIATSLSNGGLGSIGLPLSKLDALRLIAFAEEFKTPTIINTAVREASEIEIEGSKVILRNERYEAWLDQVIIHRVGPTLGIEEAEEAEAQFYKMVLYTLGRHFLPR